MGGWNVALTYRNETTQARLARKKIVVRLVAPRRVDAVANGEELPTLVIEESKVHFSNILVNLGRNLSASVAKLGGAFSAAIMNAMYNCVSGEPPASLPCMKP